MDHLCNQETFDLFCSLMLAEDQIECLVEVFFSEKKQIHNICSFVERMAVKYPNFLVKTSIRELADYAIAKSIALFGKESIEDRVEALAAFFNSFSSTPDEDLFSDISQSFYAYLSQIARNLIVCISNINCFQDLGPEDWRFGFELSRSLKFELARSPKLHFLVTYFAAKIAVEELEHSITVAVDAQKELEHENVESQVHILRTLVEQAKMKIREFLEMSQIDGIPL